MRYISTRGGAGAKGFSEILLEGLAPDGGLYVPEEYPRFSGEELVRMRAMSYPELAFVVLSRFADDIPAADLKRMIDATYTKDAFGPDIVPVKRLERDLYLLGLSEGPTLAFKDIALQLLGRLFEHALSKSGAELNVLGATSGDTGSAAEYAMRGRKGVRVFMLSPLGRMSECQRKQMYTLQDENIFNIAVRGAFDDCQDAVKAVNEDADFKKKYKLGAVNSINWARIAAQCVYYWWGYFRATGSDTQEVSFSVPSGNFGDVLAGYIAKRLGLPVKKLIVATNENNVLDEFFRTGTYRPRKGSEVAVTSSPSMDISKASNFERYVFDLVRRDAARMAGLWADLTGKGAFSVSPEEFGRIGEDGFVSGSSTHANRLSTIRLVRERYGVLIDPHTADGVATGLAYREAGVPLICLETAQAAKFAATIKEAIGEEPPTPESLRELLDLPERFEVMNPDPQQIKTYIQTRVG